MGNDGWMGDSWEDLDLDDLDVPEATEPDDPISKDGASSKAESSMPELDSFIAEVLLSSDRGHVVEWDADLTEFMESKAKRRDYPPMPARQRSILIRVACSFQLLYEVGNSLPGVDRLPISLFKTPQSCV